MSRSPAERIAILRLSEALGARFGTRMRGLTLFGSRARSEGHEESDLDLLVLIADVTREERSEVLDIAGPIEIESGIVLSPLVRNAKAWPDGSILASEIERDGVEV